MHAVVNSRNYRLKVGDLVKMSMNKFFGKLVMNPNTCLVSHDKVTEWYPSAPYVYGIIVSENNEALVANFLNKPVPKTKAFEVKWCAQGMFVDGVFIGSNEDMRLIDWVHAKEGDVELEVAKEN